MALDPGLADADSLSLAEIVDLDAFREVCKSFSELFGIGIKVFDARGKKLSDVRVATADHCGYLFRLHATQVQCTAVVGHLMTCPLTATMTPLQVDCFSGLRYKVMPILYDGTVIGRVIFGPFRPPDQHAPPAALSQHASLGLDVAQLAEYLRRIPAADEAAVEKILANVRHVFDVIIHNSLKLHMASRMHIASISEAFKDVEKTNHALKQANERLQELDRLKSNFIATVSHELRTPLTSVIGYSEMLLEGMAGVLNGEQREYVNTILEKGESLLMLIGQVLDLARIESGNLSIQKQPLDPHSLLKLCSSDIAPQAQKRGLTLVTDVAEDVPPVSADADKIRRVITNLLGNAVKFTPPGGAISVRVDVCEDLPVGETRFDLFQPERNRYMRIEVSDTGIGIPEDKLERVFDAFFQVDSSSTREFGGTGLGLAIVRNFVQAHGGRVEVRSRVGEGSTFTVKLPYAPESPVAAAGVDGLTTPG